MFARAVFDRRAGDGMQHAFHAREMFGEERAGKFHRQKLVLLVGRTPGIQRFILAVVKRRRSRGELGTAVFPLHKTVAVEVQAQLDAAGMKAGAPVKFALRKKIMPLDAVTCALKTAVERLPALAHITPCPGLGERGRTAPESLR